jgi:hypothetical protein
MKIRTTFILLSMILATVGSVFSQNFDASNYDALEYRLVGPFSGGRSAAVTGVPNQPNLFYFGATGGGVWKTENGGRAWENISDGFFGGSIGAITVAKSDPNVIYVGGGETDHSEAMFRLDMAFGKVLNAGKTWQSMGLPQSTTCTENRCPPNQF